MIYAGFWKRAIALIIDGLLMMGGVWLYALPSIASQVLIYSRRQGEPIWNSIGYANEEFVYLTNSIWMDEHFNPEMFTFSMIWIAIFIILFSLLESSKWQASPGKKIMKLYVCDMKGERLDFAQSFMRNFNKVFSLLSFNIGFILAGLTRKRQALHDMMSHCLVMRESAKEA